MKTASTTNAPNSARRLRLVIGSAKSSKHAAMAPAPPGQRMRELGEFDALPDDEVVAIVSVAVAAEDPVILTGLVEPKLSTGRFVAPAGCAAIVAVSITLPVNPPDGVTVIVEVLPEVAPALTLSATAPIAKLAGTGAVTVTVAVPDALL